MITCGPFKSQKECTIYTSSPAWWCCLQSCCQTWSLGSLRPLPCSTAETIRHQVSCQGREVIVNNPPSGNPQKWTFFKRLRNTRALLKEDLCYSNSHDVGLVYSSHPAAAFFPRQTESVLSNSEGIAPSDNLETFHHPRNTLKKGKMEN